MTTKSVPHARGVPWVGKAPAFAKDPLKLFHSLATTYGPIVSVTLFGIPFMVVSDPEYIREILVTKAERFPKSDRDLAIMGPALGFGLLTTNGAQHRTYRKLAQPAFHAKRIVTYADTMVNLADAMTATWRDGETRDINADMLHVTMSIVAKTLFDADRGNMAGAAQQIGEAIHQLQEIVNYDFTWHELMPHWLPTRINRMRKPSRHLLDTIIEGMIAERRAGAVNGVVVDRGDLLSMLLVAEDEHGKTLNDAEVRDESINLFVAGHETTSNALTWTWYLLSQNPAAAAKLHAELDRVLAGRTPTLHDLAALPYTQQVIKEAMRLYPPAWTLNARQPTEDVTVAGFLIPKGTQVFISPYVMHRLPQYFADPDEFRPERFTAEFEESLPRYAYMPFGGGPRVCIGNAYAMMEAGLVLATVAQRYSLQLAPEAKVETKPLITLMAKYGLPMIVHARQPSAAQPNLSSEPLLA